jgi:hypothetical protein
MLTELHTDDSLFSVITGPKSNSIQIPTFAPLKIAGWILKIKQLLLAH